MRKSAILFFISICFFNISIKGAHITGGKMKMIHWSNAFRIQLELERDCMGGGAQFESSINVGLFNKMNNIQIDQYYLDLDSVRSYPYQNNCNVSNRCYERAYYSYTFYFPAGNYLFDTTGYYLYWERCCLSNDIDNIFRAGETPIGIQLDIPRFSINQYQNSIYPNSSPSTNTTFNPLICLNSDFEYQFDYTDVDGDSLVYELTEPNAGGYTDKNNPNEFTGPKPYNDITWLSPYNKNSPLPSSTPFTLNAQTGLLSFKPTQLGKFIFAFAIHEYRAGVKIGTVYYESLIYVYDCTSAILMHPKDQFAKVDSTVIFRTKHSIANITYQWQQKNLSNPVFTNILNANADTLVLLHVADSMNNFQYRCYMQKSTCADITFAAKLHVLNTGIEQSSLKRITLHPNPSNTIVTVSGIDEPIKVSLYSLEGKLLKEIYHSTTMYVSDILPGMYIVRVTDKNHNSNYFGKLRIGE